MHCVNEVNMKMMSKRQVHSEVKWWKSWRFAWKKQQPMLAYLFYIRWLGKGPPVEVYRSMRESAADDYVDGDRADPKYSTI